MVVIVSNGSLGYESQNPRYNQASKTPLYEINLPNSQNRLRATDTNDLLLHDHASIPGHYNNYDSSFAGSIFEHHEEPKREVQSHRLFNRASLPSSPKEKPLSSRPKIFSSMNSPNKIIDSHEEEDSGVIIKESLDELRNRGSKETLDRGYGQSQNLSIIQGSLNQEEYYRRVHFHLKRGKIGSIQQGTGNYCGVQQRNNFDSVMIINCLLFLPLIVF